MLYTNREWVNEMTVPVHLSTENKKEIFSMPKATHPGTQSNMR